MQKVANNVSISVSTEQGHQFDRQTYGLLRMAIAILRKIPPVCRQIMAALGNMNKSVLEQESRKVRKVFEENCKALSQVHFGDFPKGACGNASSFLAAWLVSKGLRNIKYVYGERDGQSHGWLEVDGLIVDITSDQFSDGLGPVYIGSNRQFHDQFLEQTEGSCCISKILAGEFNQFMRLLKSA